MVASNRVTVRNKSFLFKTRTKGRCERPFLFFYSMTGLASTDIRISALRDEKISVSMPMGASISFFNESDYVREHYWEVDTKKYELESNKTYLAREKVDHFFVDISVDSKEVDRVYPSLIRLDDFLVFNVANLFTEHGKYNIHVSDVNGYF